MKFNKLREDAFKEMQLNAGIVLKSFEPSTATFTPADILVATTGGIDFSAEPVFTDMGEEVDNCPSNMAELKRIDTFNVKLSGTAVTITPTTVKSWVAAADVNSEKITPRMDLKETDFEDVWWVGDYSDVNGETNGGFCAIHMMKALSSAGFHIKSGKNAKGQFSFEYTAHYSIKDQNKVPFEVFVKAGSPEV